LPDTPGYLRAVDVCAGLRGADCVEIDASEERDVTTSTKVFLAGRRCDDVIVIPGGELEISTFDHGLRPLWAADRAGTGTGVLPFTRTERYRGAGTAP
jgi:hypothetical protein